MQVTKTISAAVVDTNHRPRGRMMIEVEFDEHGPCVVRYEGLEYRYTDKDGTNIATGVAVREFATQHDARVWTSLDAPRFGKTEPLRSTLAFLSMAGRIM